MLEMLLHWLPGLGSGWVFRLAHRRTMNVGRSAVERKHAAETLGLVVNQKFHHTADDIVKAADDWLRRVGH
jgi:hypothetical protein